MQYKIKFKIAEQTAECTVRADTPDHAKQLLTDSLKVIHISEDNDVEGEMFISLWEKLCNSIKKPKKKQYDTI